MIQCKAHAKPIGPGPIRELAGVVESEKESARGLVISTNGFTRAARGFALSSRIDLWGLDDLITIAQRNEVDEAKTRNTLRRDKDGSTER